MMKKFWLMAVFFCMAGFTMAEEYHFVSIEQLIEQEVGRVVLPEIYKKLGMEVSITPMPGRRAQEEAVSGVKDGEIMRIYAYGEANPSMIRVPTPYYYLETMAFIRKNSGVEIKSREDLEKYKNVKVRGIIHTNQITEGLSKEHIHEVNTTEQMMQFLQHGRADVALANTVDGMLILKKLGFEDILTVDKPLAVLDLFHYIHEKNKHLVPRVDAVISEMKQSGELDILIKKAESRIIQQVR
ncbi:transporter substrate-binding domain-containing protein [Desulfobotulus sp. H1]|uniref:Transporter substrate-binding domain-containing protein n=1 Tax=Desulfobotulus pelophilus TaxID=2823377 RepID=A0ABT3N698_9BACT|nr:transporter substrate-binding domain-containing protein [Desulfobotulus pelophilus]MCW7752970.1 transporter substrate-binding domain-containing protein [Desulfobotulus pelophilus]